MHGDIKPSNILVGHDGHLALGDFGLSHMPKRPRHPFKYCQRWDVVGTPEYMAPEVLTCDKVKGYKSTADVWSLGVVLLEMAGGFGAQGKPYFSAESDEARRERILCEPLAFESVEAVDVFLGDLVRKVRPLENRSFFCVGWQD